jgi:hypothetical protein
MVPCTFMTQKGCIASVSRSLFPPLMIDSPSQRLFTDTDMYNAVLREEMEDFYSCLKKIIHDEKLTILSENKNYDLVLDIMPTENEKMLWSYYYACHKTRCLFWLDEYDASYMISEIRGVESPAHISASPSFTRPPPIH